MTTFSSLPPEIIHVIVSYCDFQSHKGDLISLASVCQSLRSLVEPYLYREINWSWSEASTFDDLPIQSLFKSVIQRPQLASYVHHVTFQGWHNRIMWNLPAKERTPLLELVTITNLPDPKRWMSGIVMDKVDVWAALFISQLPNLRSLELVFTDRSNATYISSMLSWAVKSFRPQLSRFSHLRKVSFRAEQHPPTEPPLTIDFSLGLISPTFYLPGVQTIEMSNVSNSPPYKGFNWLGEPHRASSVTNLIIESSTIDPEDLDQLLSVCACLQSLRYEFRIDYREAYEWRPLVGDKILLALSHARATLQYLDLCPKILSSGDYQTNSRENLYHLLQRLRGPIGSLKDFTSLIDLKVPFILLLGHNPNSAHAWKDILPESLQTLTLTCGTDDAFPDYNFTEKCCATNVRENLGDATPKPAQLRDLTIRLDWWNPLFFFSDRFKNSREIWDRTENALMGRAGVSCEVEIRVRYKRDGWPTLFKLEPYKL